jgi:hypothetical protein
VEVDVTLIVPKSLFSGSRKYKSTNIWELNRNRLTKSPDFQLIEIAKSRFGESNGRAPESYRYAAASMTDDFIEIICLG